jgi:hypothetical protein
MVCLEHGIYSLFYKLLFYIPVFVILYIFSCLNLLVQVGLRINQNDTSFSHTQIRATS